MNKMRIDIINKVESPSKDCILSFEKYCRATLPPDFVEFLQYGNGGQPKKSVIPYKNGNLVIERFLPLMDEPDSDELNGQYDMSVVETQIGERLTDDPDLIGCKIIPFAALFAGDFLCFDYREDEKNPRVVVWDHEQSEEFSPYVELVAASFTDLAKILS